MQHQAVLGETAPATGWPTMKLRAVSWNMGGSFYAAQRERAWHYLCALDPDVAFLQEARPPEWTWAAFHCLHGSKIGPWCSIIASKNLPIERTPHDGIAATFFDRYVVRAHAALPDGRELQLASLHAPASAVKPDALGDLDRDAVRRPAVKDVWYNDLIYSVLCTDVTRATFLVSGDWNTSRLFDQFPKTYGAGGQSTQFFERAANDGWFECLRKFHPEEQRTYFKRRNGPYELDHAFCSQDLAGAITNCYVDDRPARDLALSDHAPIVIEFDL